MKFNYKLSSKVENFLKNAELKEIGIGCSDSQVFEIKKNNEIFFIKMASEGLLTKEYNALKWLEGKLEVPKVVLYDVDNSTEFLITEAILGEMVCSENYLKSPDESLKIIKEAFEFPSKNLGTLAIFVVLSVLVGSFVLSGFISLILGMHNSANVLMGLLSLIISFSI